MFKKVPNHPFAKVSLLGKIMNSHTGNILKQYVDKDGYLRVSIYNPLLKKGRGLYVHRAIALAFIPNPDNKPCVNHIDSNRQNNAIENLEWVTVAENNTHGLVYGSIVVGREGEDNPNNTLTEKQVHYICSLLERGESQVNVSAETRVNLNTIFSIRAGDIWKSTVAQYQIDPPKRNLVEATVILICEDIMSGMSNKTINAKYNLGRGTLRHIKTGKTFKNITKDYNWDKVQRSVDKT